MSTRDVIRTFLTAVEARDTESAARCFAENAPYQNVPHPPLFGPAGVRAMLTDVLASSTSVRWEVLSEAYVEGRGHLERFDRFVIDDVEYSVPCHAVIEVDERAQLITAFRDYVDLDPWRAQLLPALARQLARRDEPAAAHDGGTNTIG